MDDKFTKVRCISACCLALGLCLNALPTNVTEMTSLQPKVCFLYIMFISGLMCGHCHLGCSSFRSSKKQKFNKDFDIQCQFQNYKWHDPHITLYIRVELSATPKILEYYTLDLIFAQCSAVMVKQYTNLHYVSK